jgi:SNF2 family DNA or RNA helicase
MSLSNVFPAGANIADSLTTDFVTGNLHAAHGRALFHHQTDFLRAQLYSSTSTLLAGDPGTGKTLAAIQLIVCTVQAMRDAGVWRSSLYILPANLLLQIQREFQRCAPQLRLAILRTGTDRIPPVGSYDVLIVSYTLPVISRRIAEAIATLGEFALVVFDEVHLLRSIRAKRTRYWLNLARGARWVLPMSGTPFVNSGEDFFSLFYLLGLLDAPGIGVADAEGRLRPASFTQFCQRFVVYRSLTINGRHFDKPVAIKNIDALNHALTPRMQRWVAADLLSLPPVISEQHLLDMADVRDQIAALDQAKVDELLARRRAGEEISDAEIAAAVGNGSHSDSLSTYRRLIGTAKAPLVAEWIADRIAGGGGQTLIFGHHQAVLEVIKVQLDAAQIPTGLIYGRTPSGQRDRQVLEFQAGQLKVLVLQIEVAGLGLNLEAASHVVFAELPWTAAAYQQAIARAHRAGQRQHVLVSVATVPDSLDEIIAGTIARKATAAAAVLDTTPELEAAV